MTNSDRLLREIEKYKSRDIATEVANLRSMGLAFEPDEVESRLAKRERNLVLLNILANYGRENFLKKEYLEDTVLAGLYDITYIEDGDLADEVRVAIIEYLGWDADKNIDGGVDPTL